MPRRIPKGRFDDLVRQATEVFIAHGWRQCQMADVAEAVGVSKPTLYLYVESKEALFALCCQYSDDPAKLEIPELLPVPTPPPGTAVESLARKLASAAAMPVLREALTRSRADDIETELRGVVEELWDIVHANCRTLKLLDRCSDHPEVGPRWVEEGRLGPRAKLTEYVASRVSSGQLTAYTEPRLLARVLLETVATWAMHIRWDRSPEPFTPASLRPGVTDFIVRGLLPEAAAHARPPAAEPTRRGGTE